MRDRTSIPGRHAPDISGPSHEDSGWLLAVAADGHLNRSSCVIRAGIQSAATGETMKTLLNGPLLRPGGI